ncbi:MAG: DsrE/DsrF/DrsH-like family protein [Endomicrobiales bacterium]|nr:DsrE/DsrF/DrsH-like family protein [Endomicrobiales bacterium]
MSEQKEKMTIILFSGELDKAIAAFTLATTAAASGMEATIFFTFWGLNVLKKNMFVVNSKQNFLQKMFGVLNTGYLPISKFNFLGIGPILMKLLMKQKKVATLSEMMKTARSLGVKYIACTMSCGVLGLDKDDLSDEVDEFAGAISYLAEAKEAKVNLFI